MRRISSLDKSILYFRDGNKKVISCNYTGALNSFTMAIAHCQNSAIAYYNRGLVNGKLAYYIESIYDFKRSIKINPMYSSAYLYSGIAHLKSAKAEESNKNYSMAIEDFTSLLRIKPNSSSAYYLRGIAKIKLKMLRDAIEDLTMAIDINPRLELAYFERGNAKNKLYRYNHGLNDWGKAFELGHEAAGKAIENYFLKHH